ncbi:Hypothetical_protein [Hexamita inflata]|uniref:Hypothetical_protein n=1 Tax=Hexamita inflata TaxID=28002 RepID=A0AA86QB05_9EUKA|nr:Hypothetical protein HINF_LOCUS40377 [Hexamita inflata]
MMSQKYRLSVPKVLESIMNSPKVQEQSSSLDFFSRFRESEVHEVSAEHSFDSEIKIDHQLRQLKIVLMNSIQEAEQEIQCAVKLEMKIIRIEQNVSIMKINQKILVQQVRE